MRNGPSSRPSNRASIARQDQGVLATREDAFPMWPPFSGAAFTARTQTRPHLPSRRAWYDPLARRELGGQPPRTGHSILARFESASQEETLEHANDPIAQGG